MTESTSAVPASRVVVVDDTDDLRQLLSIALTRGGFEVVAEAADGRAGIETVREHRPDVVLLDLAMPVMDGIEALPAIRRLVPTARIIVLSGFGAQQMSARAVAGGADGYVQKGAPLHSILDYVRTVCDAPPGRSGRALVVVPDTRAVDADRVETAVGATGAEAETATGAEALALAPFGVLELADEPLFRVLSANAVAQRLVGEARPGSPLAMCAPELASMVSYHRLDADASFEVALGGGRARATLRRTGWSVLVYLDSSGEDVGVLRRAISTTAQQVRGPVAVLNAIADVLAADPDHAPDRWWETVVRQTRALDSITADLLTAAQVQRGTLRVEIEPVDAAEVVRRVVADQAPRDEHDEVRLEIEDEPRVDADPVRLAQAVRNLLANAHQHGAPPVTVRVRSTAGHGVVEVADRGPGVPDAAADGVFEEFARGKDGAAAGSGIGLHLVRTLARAMHGDVTVVAGPEGGALFTLRLPLATSSDG